MHNPTVLVPLDGSKFAEWALPYAIDAANKLNAAIELLGVSGRRNVLWQTSVGTHYSEDANLVDGGASEYLKATAQKIEAVSPVQVLCTVLFGSTADAIVAHSKAHKHTLVVMSSHGRGPLSRLWLGSVADRVVRHASMPVLLVRPKEGVEVDLNDRVDFRHILVGLDGSTQAEASIYWAKRLGGDETAFTLVRVEPTQAPVWSADPECAPFYVRDYSRNGHDEAESYLNDLERRAMGENQHVASVVLEGVPAAAGILRTADRKVADLIALTSHGRGRLPNLIMGSITDKVVRASSLPVLVVHRQSVESEVLFDPAIANSDGVSPANPEERLGKKRPDLLQATS